MTDYLPRLIDRVLAERFADLPAVSLVGPRAAGKTTTARRLVGNVVHLDVEHTARSFRDNPDAALRAVGEPVLLDEWQMVPEVLGAVKRAVDQGDGAGRFLLTGSAEASIGTRQWPATGRVVDLTMTGLTVRELASRVGGLSFVERAHVGGVESFPPGEKWAEAPDALGYVELALRSGFPEAVLRVPDRSRAAWIDSYVSHLVHRDVFLAGVAPDSRRLDAYLEVLAAHSATVVEAKTLYDAAGIARQTAVSYDTMLRRLGTLDLVPAWQSNRLKRLTRAPKRYLTDPALIASLLRVDASGILRDAALLGAVIDTFVAAQLRPEVALSPLRPRVFHLRDQDGHEVDTVLEYGAGRVAGIEVKAAASVGAHDARHLAWLRDRLGDRFAAGVVLHAGALTTELGDRLFAAPISTLWA